ncbi:MAG: PQQ-binding-like beta-propeller repeat protein [bacterium]|nr:PQQ-binding-like beta-propeller repeat protein [bacterium]
MPCSLFSVSRWFAIRRLERFPVFACVCRAVAFYVAGLAGFACCVALPVTASEDWPMWRADASRSAATSNALPEQLQLIWQREFSQRRQAWDDPLNLDLMTYDRVFEPVVAGGRMFIGFNDQDKLMAINTEDGSSLWTFFAEAPIRLPPVFWRDRLFVCSDDSYLYCLDAETGDVLWKFRGAPNSQHAIGNRRLTSAWPARGGPVVYGGHVYFAASIWPFMGTFLYALDASSGEVRWVNDRTGAQYIKQPHSAPSFAGVAPQGALVATEDLLIVPGGRSVPAVFDRHDGSLKYFELNAGGKGTGGSFVTADKHHFYVHTREKGTRAFDLNSGVKTAFMPNEPVLHEGKLYSAESEDGRHFIRAYDVQSPQLEAPQPLWQLEACGSGDLILAKDQLVAVGQGRITIIQLPTHQAAGSDKPSAVQASQSDSLPSIVTSYPANSDIQRLLVADSKLFAVGSSGQISVYGQTDSHASTESHSVTATPNHPATSAWVATQEQAARDLLASSHQEGYALWFGNPQSELLRSLIAISPYEQLAVIDPRVDAIQGLRRQVDDLGKYGQVTGHISQPIDFQAPQYTCHAIFVAPDVWQAALDQTLPSIYQAVRPYGGVMYLLGDASEELRAQIESLGLEQAKIEIASQGLLVRRVGALPGSSDWTHQYGNVANTIKSDDRRVKLPLGILWFGGSSNMDVLPRHGHGPPEQVVGGRLFIQGMNSLSARDVYTGRVLWKREFNDLGTYDVYYDDTYEDTPLDPQYNQVHIPGANGRGTNYVVTEDRVYLLEGGKCRVLDPATGKDLDAIELPVGEDGQTPEWGYIGVYEDLLLGGLGFANYRARHGLEFAEDSQLSRSRAGFGSKSFDRAASRALVAFDRHSGKLLWQVDANHSFWHNGIVAGKGLVYLLDKNPTVIEEAMRRRGLSMPDSYRILAVDAATGDTRWEVREGIFGSWLGYSEQFDLLLQAGAQASDRLYAEVGQGMRVYRGQDGQLQWTRDELQYAGPCILHNDLILTNTNSYAESAGAFFLKTGEQKMVKNPLTGSIQPWKMTRAYGCNNIIASENLLTFRSGAAGYYDLQADSGTGNLGGFKSGCTSNLVVANGVLNAPDYTRTCSCSYQNQTSLALVHMPDMELWSVHSLANTAEPGEEIRSMGINFGAPGDRRDEQGVLWLEYPPIAGTSPQINIDLNEDASFFQRHSLAVKQTEAALGADAESDYAWVFASGIENARELRIQLKIGNAYDVSTGLPVSHPEDDAEENSAGEVSLSSSDLELTEDGGEQVVGLRFASVQLQPGAKVRRAYLQFTCDEASDEPTSLMIAGERHPNSLRFRANSHDISARSRTRSEIAWQPPAWTRSGESSDAQRTPDLAAIVEEIIAQPDWQPGNAMTFIVSGTGKRIAVASRGPSEDAVRLVVEADTQGTDVASDSAAAKPYDVDLLFFVPQDSVAEDRVFSIEIQGELVEEDLKLPVDVSAGVRRTFSNVAISNRLDVKLIPKQGQPVLSGIRIQSSTWSAD